MSMLGGEAASFTREELQELRKRANRMSTHHANNELWAHAYWDLARACDLLDAMAARDERR